ncbi:MAG: M48 family metallopeptidase [Desulfotalea sp.]
MNKLYLLIIIFCATQLTACATSPTGRNQLMLVSPNQAISSSRSAYIQTIQPLRKQGKIDNNAAVSKRVRIITGKIVAQTIQVYPETRNWRWEVRVIDDPKTINAWCMAGGKMAVYTGIIDQINITDDELAQVMGHEVSHAVANHTAEKMSMAMASQIGLMGIAIAANDSDNRGAIMSGSVLAASLAVSLPNSRAAEEEADAMGIKLAAMAGYDPRAAATLWKKMGEKSGGGPPEFLSTHPSPANRQNELRAMATKMMPYYKAKKHRPTYPLP